MSKFKVGDKVFVLQHAPKEVRGKHATIVEVDRLSSWPVEALVDETRRLELFREDELSAISEKIAVGKKIYIIGSLRNPAVGALAQNLRTQFPGVEVFDDWMAAGPEADDYWRDYEKAKGNTLAEALKGHAARHVFEYDKGHLDSSDVVILALPAGKSGHLELGYSIGKGKKSAILLDAQPDRYDVMYGFADLVTDKQEELAAWLKEVL